MVQVCPNCDRHCPIDNLHCGRGREYFGIAEPADTEGRKRGHHMRAGGHGHGHGMTNDCPKAIHLLRECGHQLHHGMGDPSELVAPLTDRELEILERLLEKCLYRR